MAFKSLGIANIEGAHVLPKVIYFLCIQNWQEKNHENYLNQIDRKNHLLLFSSFDHDGHFEDSIVDEGFDVDKIVQTQMMIEEVREIIDRLYFNDETIRSVAETKKISHPALIKTRNKILDKLRELLKDFR